MQGQAVDEQDVARRVVGARPGLVLGHLCAAIVRVRQHAGSVRAAHDGEPAERARAGDERDPCRPRGRCAADERVLLVRRGGVGAAGRREGAQHAPVPTRHRRGEHELQRGAQRRCLGERAPARVAGDGLVHGEPAVVVARRARAPVARRPRSRGRSGSSQPCSAAASSARARTRAMSAGSSSRRRRTAPSAPARDAQRGRARAATRRSRAAARRRAFTPARGRGGRPGPRAGPCVAGCAHP